MKLGRFAMRSTSDDEEEGISTGSFFTKKMEPSSKPATTPQSKSTVSAIRAASAAVPVVKTKAEVKCVLDYHSMIRGLIIRISIPWIASYCKDLVFSYL